MSIRDLLTQELSEVAPLIASGEVSPVELTQATLDLIHQLNPTAKSYTNILDEMALSEAQAAESEIASGRYKGALHGIPYSIKETLATKGIPSTAGSVILKDYLPDYDSTVGSRTRAAGGVLVGKNNLHEWASGSTNDNPHFGRAGNSWALDRIPGGSSGGSAAAVSLGMGYFSYGTDGAGSVRMPAGFCGVVGIKASYALISRYGMIPPIGPGQDHGPGILARSIRDSAVIMNAIVGRDSNDPAAYDYDAPDYLTALEKEVKGMRVGIPSNYYFDLIDPEVEAAIRAAIDVLAGLGVRFEDVHVPFIDEAMAVSFVGGPSEFHRSNLRARRQDYGEDLRYRFMAQEFTLAKDAARAAKVRDIFKAGMQQILSKYDALISATTIVPAYPFEADEVQIGSTTVDMKDPGAANEVCLRMTRPSNIACISSVSVPCGLTSGGLPIGLQLLGRPLGEIPLFALGHQYGVASGNAVAAVPPMVAAEVA
jgi:aspartyl-tRNA(Asn)/glutamyl-tRNA(Gln) amidotransferase subunit A